MHHLNPYAPKPPKKYMVEFDAFRKLTWSERLKILCGYNLQSLRARRHSSSGKSALGRRQHRAHQGTETRNPMTFYDRALNFPPCLVRLLARDGGRGFCSALSTDEIAESAGLSPMQVNTLSQQTNWRGVDLPTLQAFTIACGLDFSDRRCMVRALDYLDHNPTFSYLRRHPDWTTYYLPLMMRWAEAVKTDDNLVPQLRRLVGRLSQVQP